MQLSISQGNTLKEIYYWEIVLIYYKLHSYWWSNLGCNSLFDIQIKSHPFAIASHTAWGRVDDCPGSGKTAVRK